VRKNSHFGPYFFLSNHSIKSWNNVSRSSELALFSTVVPPGLNPWKQLGEEKIHAAAVAIVDQHNHWLAENQPQTTTTFFKNGTKIPTEISLINSFQHLTLSHGNCRPVYDINIV
jgi:hypothetical protein